MRPSKQFCFWDTICKNIFQGYSFISVWILDCCFILPPQRGPKQKEGSMNWFKRSHTIRVSGTTALTTPHVWTNHRILFFWNNQSFWFCRVPRNFFEPLKPSLALETPLMEGHTSKTFWSELRFWSYRWQYSYFLA